MSPPSVGLVTTNLAQATDPTLAGRGLVRRELDRAVTQWALSTSNATGLESTGEVIAPEVTSIEFLYCDGLEWRTEWDTEAEGKLPLAIQVILAIGPSDAVGADLGTVGAGGMQRSSTDNVTLYRMIVHLPAATAAEEETSELTSAGL
jgi:hypothetical protein